MVHRRVITLALLALSIGAVGVVSCDSDTSDGPRSTVAYTPRDFGYMAEGYRPTVIEGRIQAAQRALVYREVDESLPVLDFTLLRKSMMAEDGQPIVTKELAALEGKRVRIYGYVTQPKETSNLRSFVMTEKEAESYLDVEPPPLNEALVVNLQNELLFEFTDAPHWMEGVLRFGRVVVEPWHSIAIFSIDDAYFQEMPAENMVIPAAPADPYVTMEFGWHLMRNVGAQNLMPTDEELARRREVRGVPMEINGCAHDHGTAPGASPGTGPGAAPSPAPGRDRDHDHGHDHDHAGHQH